MDFDIIIAVIVIGLILISSSRKKKYAEVKRQRQVNGSLNRAPASPRNTMPMNKIPNTVKAGNTLKGGNTGNRVRAERSMLLKSYEDRNNDWLANQMREERISLYRLQEMFSFRMQGRNVTDAELLKEFHVEHCNAGGVDTASGK